MKLSEFYQIANKFAPKALSDEYCERYGAYDNSGVLVDTGDEIEKALFSLDLTKAAIQKAKEIGANLIVTHHPAIYGKIGAILSEELLGEKLLSCIKKGISVLSMHLNLDGAAGGIDESLAQGVQKAAGRSDEKVGVKIMHPLSCGGYGRVYKIEKCTAGELAKRLEKEFSTERVLVYGAEREVEKAASFCGAGGDEEGLRFAKSQGADVMISADFKHHVIAAAIEEGLSVIVLTHYASENYGFKKYYEKICRQAGIPCVYHEDEILL